MRGRIGGFAECLMHFAYPFLHFLTGIPVPCMRCGEVVRFFVSGLVRVKSNLN